MINHNAKKLANSIAIAKSVIKSQKNDFTAICLRHTQDIENPLKKELAKHEIYIPDLNQSINRLKDVSISLTKDILSNTDYDLFKSTFKTIKSNPSLRVINCEGSSLSPRIKLDVAISENVEAQTLSFTSSNKLSMESDIINIEKDIIEAQLIKGFDVSLRENISISIEEHYEMITL